MRTGALLLVFGSWVTAQAADIAVPGGVLRVERSSQVRIADGQVELTRGTITYQVNDAGASQLEILTPSVTAKASEDGAYRIVVRKTGESEITAQSGRMVVMAPGGEQWLDAGQRMIARGPRANPQYRIVAAAGWWRRLAGMLQNMQIGGGGGVEVGSGGGEEKSAAKTSRTKPETENSAVSSRSAHDSGDRAKTSDNHTAPANGGAHSSDSRHADGSRGSGGGGSHNASGHAGGANGGSSGGGGGSHAAPSHSAPAAGSSSSHSSESHSTASSSHSDSSSKGK